MSQQTWRRWLETAGVCCVALLLLGCSFARPAGAMAQEHLALAAIPASLGLDGVAVGYQAGGTLGFALRDTAIQEQLYRRSAGAERGVLWSAEFVSRWPLDEGQLDRWSAQVIGLVADALGDDVRLAGYERLDAADVGEQRIAYRYQLGTANGQPLGDATIVVFSRGDQVGLTASGAVGSRAPVDATSLARTLDRAVTRG